jgi:hypothetical protein
MKKRAVERAFCLPSIIVVQRRGKSFQLDARALATTVWASRPRNNTLKIATIVMISHMA